MVKVNIISGFLGAGKTTLIQKLLKEALSGDKTVLIENEFGEIGIDAGFLQDKPIVLLDEVLEGLDEEYIRNILPAILDYCKGRTLLYITHDLSVLDAFERVIEFRDGQIVYDGAQSAWTLEQDK